MSLDEMVKTWVSGKKWWCGWCGEDLVAGRMLYRGNCGGFCNSGCYTAWLRDVYHVKKEQRRLADLRECRHCKQMKPRLNRSVFFCSVECRQADQREKWRLRNNRRYHTDTTYRQRTIAATARRDKLKRGKSDGREEIGLSADQSRTQRVAASEPREGSHGQR